VFEIVAATDRVATLLITVVDYDAFKAMVVALGLAVFYATRRVGDGKQFRAAGVGPDYCVIFDTDVPPPTFASDLPSARLADSVDPT